MIDILNKLEVAIPLVLSLAGLIIGKVSIWWKQMRNGGNTHKKVSKTLELMNELTNEIKKLKNKLEKYKELKKK